MDVSAGCSFTSFILMVVAEFVLFVFATTDQSIQFSYCRMRELTSLFARANAAYKVAADRRYVWVDITKTNARSANDRRKLNLLMDMFDTEHVVETASFGISTGACGGGAIVHSIFSEFRLSLSLHTKQVNKQENQRAIKIYVLFGFFLISEYKNRDQASDRYSK